MRASLLALLLCGNALTSPAAEPNTLTTEEQAAGWRLLFDGRSTEGWRSFKGTAFPERGWKVEDGWLIKEHRVRGGDIVTLDEFDEFELTWEWKITPRGNNGVKYFIPENRSGAIGHEYQMMDDTGRRPDKHSTASFYDVLAPEGPVPGKPPGEINFSRIVVRGNEVEHWLNGVKVLSYTLGSSEVLAAVTESKFQTVPGFGTKIRGHILLTDHGDGASFRNVKIRTPTPSSHD